MTMEKTFTANCFNPAEAEEWFRRVAIVKTILKNVSFNPAEAEEWFRRNLSKTLERISESFNPAEAEEWFRRRRKCHFPFPLPFVSIQPKPKNGLEELRLYKY